jgi:hypothetical protein
VWVRSCNLQLLTRVKWEHIMGKYSIVIGSAAFLVLLYAISIIASPRHADTLTVRRTVPSPFTLANGSFAEWTGDNLVLVENRFSDSPTLTSFDREGNEISKFNFTIPRAGLIDLFDNSVVFGKDGSVALAGTAFSNDSRGAAFVAWVSPDRQHQTLMRPTGFHPQAVTMTSDGAIWVSGYLKTTQPGEKLDDTHERILRYDRSGSLLGSVSPLPNANPDSDYAHRGRPPSILVPLPDRIGWYFAGARAYIEFSFDGSPLNRFKTPEHRIADLIDVAACRNGDVFATTSIIGSGGAHWGIFSLNRERGDWTLSTREEKWGRLFGCDGTQLVAMTDFHNISWLDTAGN